MEEKRKVILINGTNANWYEQVIFIIKNNNEYKIPNNLVLEAEKIINEYLNEKQNKNNLYLDKNILKEKHTNKKTAKNKKTNINSLNMFLNISMFCTITLICFLIYKISF